ncbi:MAG: spore cortex biosynthesis protein YabQ [Clostridiales bacterium]|nr:spore cortex biosynthesis protein YabQ [Clostridiales bacterium]
MEVAVALQLRELGTGLLTGLGLGLFYDLLRILRRRRPGRGLGLALDVVFWLTVCAALLLVTLETGTGIVRGYTGAAIAGGCLLYLWLVSPLLLPLGLRAAEGLAVVWHFLTTPARVIRSTQKKFWKILKNHFLYWEKWYIVEVLFVKRPERLFPRRVKGARKNETQAQQFPVQAGGADSTRFRGPDPAHRPGTDPNRPGDP